MSLYTFFNQHAFAFLAANPLCGKTMFYCALILVICAIVAFIIVKNERPRRKLAMAIESIGEREYQKAYDLLTKASNYGYPENVLCLAFVSAKLNQSADCLGALKRLVDYPSTELNHLTDYLETKNDALPLDAYIHQADYYYAQAEAIITTSEDDDNNQYISELNQKFDYAIICVLVECMIALLARGKEAQLAPKSLVKNPEFIWLQAIRQTRLSDE